MSDLTTQQFREAADQCTDMDGYVDGVLAELPRWRDMFLAAAEQRAQLDAAQQQIAALRAELASVREVWSIDLDIAQARVLTLEIENQRLKGLDKPPTHSVE